MNPNNGRMQWDTGHNVHMALTIANRKHTMCYNTLVGGQQQLRGYFQAYKLIYEQNEQLMNEMHGFTTTNVSLRQFERE